MIKDKEVGLRRRLSASLTRSTGHLVFISLLLIGLSLYPLRIMGLRLEALPGSMGDARLQMYVLEHGYRASQSAVVSFWDAPFFYPQPNVLAYSDTHLGSLPLYMALRAAGLEVEEAFQAWFIALMAFGYVLSCYSLRKVGFSMPVAAASAYPFAFSLPLIAQIDHLQVIEHFPVPLAFLCLWKWLNGGGFKYAFGAGFVIVWQTYCYIYGGYFLVVAASVFVAVAGIIMLGSVELRRRAVELCPRTPSARLAGVVGIGVLTVLLGVLLSPYLNAFDMSGGRSIDEVRQMVPRWQSYLSPHASVVLWQGLVGINNGLPSPWEHNLFPGGLPMLAMILSIPLAWSARTTVQGRFGIVSAITLLVMVCGTTMWGESSPYLWAVTHLPGVSAIRAVGRVIFVELFLLSACLATALWHIETRCKRQSARWIVTVVACGLLVADGYFDANGLAYEKSAHLARVQGVIDGLKTPLDNDVVLAYMPAARGNEYVYNQLDAMFAGQRLDVPTINGYSGLAPPEYSNDTTTKIGGLQAWAVRANEVFDIDFQDRILIVGRRESSLPRASRCVGPLTSFAAEVSVPTAMLVRAGDEVRVPVVVKNLSAEPWCSVGKEGGMFGIGVVSRWLGSDGREVLGPEYAGTLEGDVPPGGVRIQRAAVKVPITGGHYRVEFEMLQQGVAFFRSKGMTPAVSQVTVVAPSVVRGEHAPPGGCGVRLERPRAKLRLLGFKKTRSGFWATVEARNDGEETWCAPAVAEEQLAVGFVGRWTKGDSETRDPFILSTLVYDVPPGSHAIGAFEVTMPEDVAVTVEVDLYQSGAVWFRAAGSIPLAVKAHDLW